MDAVKRQWLEDRAARVVEKLKAHDFGALYVKTRQEAVKEIYDRIAPGAKIGVGGSITIRALGILDLLKARGDIVYDHWIPGQSEADSIPIRKAQLSADWFLSSVNAVTTTGELIAIDGIGNRVNGITFGPAHVIVVAGYNKIVDDIQAGIRRAKDVSAPINAKRLNVNVPCAKAGRCVDCNSPNRICRAIVIHERRPIWTDVLIVLVGEELGY